MEGHWLDIVKDGVAYRIAVTRGTVHIGGGWMEVRPETRGSATNFAGVSFRHDSSIEEKIARLNELMAGDPRFKGAVVTMERLERKEVNLA